MENKTIRALKRIIEETELYREKTALCVDNLWHIVKKGEIEWIRMNKNKDLEKDENMLFFFTDDSLSGLDKSFTPEIEYLAKNIFGEHETVFELAQKAFGFPPKKEDVAWIIVGAEHESLVLNAGDLLYDFTEKE